MDFVSLSLLAVAVVGLGSVATVFLARSISLPVAELASQHGRFVGLGEQRVKATPYRKHVRKEAMNVVGTTN